MQLLQAGYLKPLVSDVLRHGRHGRHSAKRAKQDRAAWASTGQHGIGMSPRVLTPAPLGPFGGVQHNLHNHTGMSCKGFRDGFGFMLQDGFRPRRSRGPNGKSEEHDSSPPGHGGHNFLV